jgi:hypothetical protein
VPTCLLDKNVVRRAIEGIGKTQIGRTLTDEELAALRLLLASEQDAVTLSISVEVQHILLRYRESASVQLFHTYVSVLHPVRYFKRWARRLRGHGFTREDAKVLALATFGSELPFRRLGAEWIMTYDRALIHHVSHLRGQIIKRLKAMTAQLHAPYTAAQSPIVYTPHDF